MAEKQNETNNPVEQEVDQVEIIDSAIEKSENFIENNGKSLLIGLIAILLVIFGVMAYKQFFKGPKEIKAAEMMYPAEQAFQKDSFAVALNGNSNVVGFLSIIDEFSSTNAGNAAKAYAGICYKKLGDNENAIKYLDSYSSNESALEPAIEGAIGDCYWDLQKEDNAIKAYNKAIEAENLMVSPIYLRRLGLLYLKKGDKSNAKVQFQAIKEKYSSSSQAQDIDKYLSMCN